ncbi:hypothetical protein QQX98_003612 [Neonectria punicea]|uniref:Enoyl reductase (ER) domain-containing protein n=1 Tax=Neonectria punicea TaxID=979145 RepID=A0ABR1HDI8_9HYPO
MSSSPSSYKAVLVESAGAPLALKDVPLGEPSSDEVLVKVIAGGICHMDAIVQTGYLGNAFPRIPGHEIVGDIVKVGEGVTAFRPGDRVGGSWGHLAVQFANRMGFKVVALSSGDSKRDFAKQLGAHQYIDTSTEDPIAALTALGGAAIIVATAPNAKAISPLVQGLRSLGKLLVLAPVGNIEFDTTAMTRRGASVHTWPSGNILDAEETLEFAKLHGIKCLIEKFLLKDADKAMGHMLSGAVRFRSVLVMDE